MNRLQLSKTKVEGCVTFKTDLFEDVRGFFCETFNERDFDEAGLPIEWAQDNISSSKIGVLRGLHIQRCNPQGKLVRCIKGRIYDVCLDLRPNSQTFLKWHGETLEGGNCIYLPPGTAHGFVSLEEDSTIYYKCTTLYDKATDGGVYALGTDINIEWPTLEMPFTMSEKDIGLPITREWLKDPRGIWNE